MPILLAACCATACGGDETKADGRLDVRIWGEDYIEEGIPADAFADGWEVSFDRFLVALDGVATPVDEDSRRYLFDLTAVSGGAGNKVVELVSAPGVAELAYRIGPGDAATRGNASSDAVTLLEENGWSIYVEGHAKKEAVNITFAWGFSTDTSYQACEVADEVPEATEVRTLITIHADHLFYDDLEDPEPNVTFDLVATADADMDGIVTTDELLAVDITAQERYQVGSRDITNLWDFIEAQSATLGHIDGEGHCETE